MKETHPPKAEDTTREYYLKNLGIVDLETNNWTWYVTGADRVAKITPLPHQQPAAIDSGDTTLNDNLYSSFYLYDLPIHIGIGNTRIVYTPTVQCPGYVFDTIDYVADYYPYGKTLRQYTNGPTEKFLTTQHERDAETGLDYRGARFYDADIARFLSLDPHASAYLSWSPYNYVLSNPVMFIDPDGKDADWVPVVQGGALRLVEEEGDDASTLADFLDVSNEEAKVMYDAMECITVDYVTYNYVTPTDANSENINAIINETENPSGNDYVDDWIPDGAEANYNCFRSCLALAKGNIPNYSSSIDPAVFSTTLSQDYVNVSGNPDVWNYGRTLVRFGDENGNSTHGATYLGTSKGGTQYFWTKNGNVTAPIIMSLQELEQMWGKNQGVGNDNNGGYYNYAP